jgi:hypothetical protein
MSIQTVEGFGCGNWQGKPVEIEAVEENLTSDGGLLVFSQLDEKLGWTAQFAKLISDPRTAPQQSALSIVRQRVFGIIAGYEDQNDHDTLRTDPMFKMMAGRVPGDIDLASQPTISRLENSVSATNLLMMQDWCIEQFVNSFQTAPSAITLDIDTMDDPTHGQQQLTFFHGYYKQYQYLVRYVTCAENDMVVLPQLLFGDAPAKLGAVDQLHTIITRFHQRFPDTPIHIRADSAFGGPEEYETLESLPNVTYTIGMKLNPRIKRLSEHHLTEAKAEQEKTQCSQLRFLSLEEYDSKQWSSAKTVVVKTEVTEFSSSQRAVITNVPNAAVDPYTTYLNYAMRGESENRNKELKCDLCADRLSDHRFMANMFRVLMHCIAHNLVVRLRQLVAVQTSTPVGPSIETASGANVVSSSDSMLQVLGAVSTNESSGNQGIHTRLHGESDRARRGRHNARHRRNCLGEGHPRTYRMLVTKVAARIIVSARRVRILLSASWPNVPHLRRAALAVKNFAPH